MKIALTRSGGFTGITMHREIDTAQLPPDERKKIEQLVARARAEPPPRERSPDAFEYAISIDSERYVIRGAPAPSPASAAAPLNAWRMLIDQFEL